MITAIGTLLGGIGLFLIGMHHLTEGLKQSAGNHLEDILNRWTQTKSRSFFSGFTLTALVQSSSLVTVAIIGFVNAGLLNLGQAVWVVFGSNLGTTMTAWIVALLGFTVKVELFALPLVGIGALLHVLSTNSRWRAIGGATVGFGLLFVGLDFLQDSFSQYKDSFELVGAKNFDVTHVLLLLMIGFIMTVIMQSSSASVAMLLTLVNAKIIPIELGAAAVIGANIGTTSTALLATLGATANAKRVAWAHVFFNLISGIAALLLLPLVFEVFSGDRVTLAGGDAALWLAIYHTLFNLLGVIIMLRFEPMLTKFLERQFQPNQEETLQLKYLDKNVVTMPQLALQSACNELHLLLRTSSETLRTKRLDNDVKARTHQIVNLLKQFDHYIILVLKQPMANSHANAFSEAIKCSQSLVNAHQLFQELSTNTQNLKSTQIQRLLTPLKQQYDNLLDAFTTNEPAYFLSTELITLTNLADQALTSILLLSKEQYVTEEEVTAAIFWITQHKRIARQLMKVQQRCWHIEDVLRPEFSEFEAQVSPDQ